MTIETRRNSAAASAADASASAASAARTARRSVPAPVCAIAAGAPRAPGRAASATGACSANIASQERRSVSSPPAAGPTAAPITPAVAHVPSPCSGSCRSRSSSDAPSTAAPAMPCTTRPPMSGPRSFARPQAMQAAANTTIPAARTTSGRRRASIAPGTANTASAMLNDTSTHATSATVVSSSRRISGSASVTIDESARTRPAARASGSRYLMLRAYPPVPRLGAQALGDHRAPVELVLDVDGVVLAVRPDAPGAEEPAPEAQLALLLELAREAQLAADDGVVLALVLRDAVDEDRVVAPHLARQLDDRAAHAPRL